MNAASWVLVGLAVVFALANWWARANEDRRLEYITKPTVTALVLAAALVLDPANGSMRGWFVAGFALCLVGDVLLMLPKEQFIGGLGAFLVAHALFAVGFFVPGHLEVLALLVGVVVVLAGALMVGRTVVVAASRQAGALGVAVGMYMLVISVMVVAAFAHGSTWGVVGALAFFASDAMLGFDRFVGHLAGAPVAIMASYHLALFGLLLSLP